MTTQSLNRYIFSLYNPDCQVHGYKGVKAKNYMKAFNLCALGLPAGWTVGLYDPSGKSVPREFVLFAGADPDKSFCWFWSEKVQDWCSGDHAQTFTTEDLFSATLSDNAGPDAVFVDKRMGLEIYGNGDLPKDSWLRSIVSGIQAWWIGETPPQTNQAGLYTVSNVQGEAGKVRYSHDLVDLVAADGTPFAVPATELFPTQPAHDLPMYRVTLSFNGTPEHQDYDCQAANFEHALILAKNAHPTALIIAAGPLAGTIDPK